MYVARAVFTQPRAWKYTFAAITPVQANGIIVVVIVVIVVVACGRGGYFDGTSFFYFDGTSFFV